MSKKPTAKPTPEEAMFDDDFVSGGVIPGQEEKTEQDKSFEASFATGEVAGRELHPFCAMRTTFAQKLGMIYPNVDPNDADWEKDKAGEFTKFSYPGLVQDIVIIAYACWLDELSILRAGFQPPVKCLKAMYAWADAHGLAYPSEGWTNAANTVGQILSSHAANGAEVELPEGAEPGKA